MFCLGRCGSASGSAAGYRGQFVKPQGIEHLERPPLNKEKPKSPTISNMEEKYDSLEKAFNETTTHYPLIQRVPYMLRNHKYFGKYFEPRVMAIGLLHHPLPHCGKSHLLPAEKHKRRLAFLFVKESGLNTDVLYSKIWTEIQGLKECFDQETIKSFTDEELGWILFVDGCAVLQLIKCVINDKWEEMNMKPNESTVIMSHDLFLLENQIPFRVLELLTSPDPSQKKQWHWRDVIQKLAELNKGIESTKEDNIVSIEIESTKEEDIVKPVHLLDLLRTYLAPKANTSPNSKNRPKKRAENCWNIFCNVKDKDNGWHIFRNVKDLKSAGISVHHSGTSLLTDISFNTSWCFTFKGVLNLPFITVDDFTGSKFMNLIAYEMCPDYKNNFTVISYICFMDSLIDQAEDVQELRRARILLNFLGSDDEVAQLFNEIGTDLLMNPEVYRRVKKKIEKHYGKKWNTWVAKGLHDHFSSPWTTLAFFGALMVLGLTAIQTWFTVSSNW